MAKSAAHGLVAREVSLLECGRRGGWLKSSSGGGLRPEFAGFEFTAP